MKALAEAKAVIDKPSLLICRTEIAHGSPNKAGSELSHGSPLGEEEIKLTRKNLGWSYAPFEIPDEMYQQWDAKTAGQHSEDEWNKLFTEYQQKWPTEAREYQRRLIQNLPEKWHEKADEFIHYLQNNPTNIATRKASQIVIEKFGSYLPEYLGGCADITSSCLTSWTGSKPIRQYDDGNFINYGVREFGMTAIANGIALHGGFIPYTSTFLMFMEYARNAVRMSALMKLRHIMVYTHDSIGMGEDGPTHQPVEQMASLRLTPNMRTWRPCDPVETAVAWRSGIERVDGPTALSLSRQVLKQHPRTPEQIANIARGGYILYESTDNPQLILIATGSEVDLATEAYNELVAQGYRVRLVSMPSPDTFDTQSTAYRDQVLPRSVRARLAIEASSAQYWERYVGLDGAVLGMKTFGESAPAEVLFPHFGFTVENIIHTAKNLL